MSMVYLVPILVFLIFQVTFIGTYLVAVVLGHVVPDVPYISDSGTYSPESCIFGQMMNMGAALLGLATYIRHRQVEHIYEYHPELNVRGLVYNKISGYFAFMSCFGVTVVANFQETNVRFVHYAGAFCAFGFGTLYFWMQSIISVIIKSVSGSKILSYLRIAMTVACSVFFVVQAVTGLLSHIYFNGDNPRKWYPSDGGWMYHVISSISEWIVATLFCFYILSFTDEFKDVNLGRPQVTISYRINFNSSLNIESSPIIESSDSPS